MKYIQPVKIPKIKALGLNNINGVENPTQKRLSIKYLGCEQKLLNLILRFEIEAIGLRDSTATLHIFKDNENDFSSSDSFYFQKEINPNGRKILEVEALVTKEIIFGNTNKKLCVKVESDGISSKKVNFIINFTPEKIRAGENIWKKAAKDLGINDSDLIRAMAQQESENIAFLASGNPKVLYERHHFYNFYSKKYGKQKADDLYGQDDNIANPKSGGYGSEKFFRENGSFDNEGYYNYQYERLEKAMMYDKDIAIMSSSFGILQVLGEYCNYSKKTPSEFMKGMYESEIFQIEAFVAFIKGDRAKRNLPKALNSKDWELVASTYNGANWKEQNPLYANNLKNFYTYKPWLKK